MTSVTVTPGQTPQGDPPAPRLEARLLGGFRIRALAGAEEDAAPFGDRLPTPRAALLLGYLACFPERRPTRDSLLDVLWPGQETETARNGLRVTLNRLRQFLEGLTPGAAEAVDTSDRRCLSLRRSLWAPTDKQAFDTLLARAEASAASDAEEMIRAALAASEAYSGPFLDGYTEPWVFAEREALVERYITVLRRALRPAVDRRAFDVAMELARRARDADPLREGSHRDLIRLHQLMGNVGAARRQYQELEQILREQGMEPSPATRSLAAQLVAPPAAPAPAPEMPPVTPPRIAAGPAFGAPPLPRALTQFFGREAELQDLRTLLAGETPRGPRRRLVTLTGAGGNGKTRLARETALSLYDEGPFAGKVWWQALTGPADRDEILGAVAARLGGRAEGLVILDNAEVVLETAAEVVRYLLEQYPGLSLLVTSRSRLGLAGEQEFPVPPLPVPPPAPPVAGGANLATLLTQPAVLLFADRAQLAQPRFRVTAQNGAAVAALCARLDGSPLAIELAAAWIRTLSPEQILERLSARRFDLLVSRDRDTPEKHRSLRIVIEESEVLLPPGAQRLFHRLSVFRGGFTAESAEAIGSEKGVGDRLADLVAGSLVIQDGERYRLTETLRAWGNEQLLPRERLELRRSHADYYASAGRSLERLTLPDMTRTHTGAATLESEVENLRAASDFCAESGDTSEIERGLRVASVLGRIFLRCGYLVEGRARLRRHLERAESAAAGGTLPEAWLEPWIEALVVAARFAATAGDEVSANRHYARIVELKTRIAEPPLPSEEGEEPTLGQFVFLPWVPGARRS